MTIQIRKWSLSAVAVARGDIDLCVAVIDDGGDDGMAAVNATMAAAAHN